MFGKDDEKSDHVILDQLVESILKRNAVNGKKKILTTWAKVNSRVKCWLQVVSTLIKISAQAVEALVTSNANSSLWYLFYKDDQNIWWTPGFKLFI